MREQIREIVIQAIAGTKDLTEAIDQLCVLSDVSESMEFKEEKPNGSYYVECSNCGELTHQRLIKCEHCGLTVLINAVLTK